MCYAIEWTYGRATDSKTGNRIGRYYGFDTTADRQAWIADAKTAYTTQSGFRETIESSDPELRRILRNERLVRDAATSVDLGGVDGRMSNYRDVVASI